MVIINTIISICTAYVVIFKSPFSLRITALFMFSAVMAYQLAVVARSYMLLVLLLFAIAWLYTQRHKMPLRYAALVALLGNTEVMVAIPCAILTGLFFMEARKVTDPAARKTHIRALGIMAFGGVVALVSVWPHAGSNEYVGQLNYFNTAFIIKVTDFMIPWAHFIENPWAPNAFSQWFRDHHIISALPGITVLLLTSLLIKKSPLQLLHLGWIAGLYFIYTFKYFGQFYHGELMLVYTFFMVWLWRQENPGEIRDNRQLKALSLLSWILTASLSVSVVGMVNEYHTEYKTPFSGSKDMASYIKENGYDRKTIAFMGCYSLTSVAAYLPETDFWFVGEDKHARYMVWSKVWDECQHQPFSNQMERLVQQYNYNTVIVSEQQLPTEFMPLKLLHYSPGRMIFESFWLYKRDDGHP